MDAQAAARSGDEIAHGVGMAAMIGGALLGALAGAALVVATAATGGVAAVIVAGAVAGGGLSVGSLVKGLATICNLPEPGSGVLMAGSLNVWVNSRPAQRASLDRAAVCSGFPMNHYSLPMPLVAEGSASVFINGCPAARLSSKLICGAHIKSASPNVTWGGPTVRTDAVFDREEWLRTGLQGLGVLALVGGCLVGSFAGAVITAGAFVIGSVVFGALRQWGDSLGPGYADLFEGVAGIALLAGGARAAAKAKMPAVAEGEGGGAKGGIAVAEDATNSVSYARPSGYRVGVRDQVWENAVKNSPDGLVRDPLTGRIINKNEPWDMGHLPGHEFRRIKADAEAAGLSREQFLDIHNDPQLYRPELPSSNRSHALEDMSDLF